LDDAESAKRQAVDQVSLDTEQAYLKVEEASQRVAVAAQPLLKQLKPSIWQK
jgi:hypothetical protein